MGFFICLRRLQAAMTRTIWPKATAQATAPNTPAFFLELLDKAGKQPTSLLNSEDAVHTSNKRKQNMGNRSLLGIQQIQNKTAGRLSVQYLNFGVFCKNNFGMILWSKRLPDRDQVSNYLAMCFTFKGQCCATGVRKLVSSPVPVAARPRRHCPVARELDPATTEVCLQNVPH